MKLSKAEVRGKATLGIEIRFETQNLTSYSGLILFQHFFSLIGIKERLWRCFRHLKANPIYGHHVIVMLLIVHLIICWWLRRCGRVAPGDYSPEALTRTGQGDCHHPAPPLMCLVAILPISALQLAGGEAGSVPVIGCTAPT